MQELLGYSKSQSRIVSWDFSKNSNAENAAKNSGNKKSSCNMNK